MASLREIRRQIKADKSIQQITKAMKLVAASRLRRAQTRMLAARPFAQKMEEMISGLLTGTSDLQRHPLVIKRSSSKRILILVTSDKGLCGGFNTNLIRMALRYFSEHGLANVDLVVVGRKGRDRFSHSGPTTIKDYVNVFNTLSYAQAELVISDLLLIYQSQPYAAVDILYSEFKSLMHQKPVIKPFLPLAPFTPSNENSSKTIDFIYEPEKAELVSALIPRFLKAQMYRVLLESNASELASRMIAMDNATRNASDLIASLTLEMNRTRQASITKEILEVVSGAEALR